MAIRTRVWWCGCIHLLVHLSMTSKSQFPDLDDGVLVIPSQMRHTEVVQYIRTYKGSIRQVIISDRTEGLKKILKELEHCAKLEYIEIKQCGISSKENLKVFFKTIFDKCPNLKQISNVNAARETSGTKNFKTMIKRKGSTIVEIGVKTETIKE